MEKTKNRITILTGHYGSGKTEIAVNMAVAEKATANTPYQEYVLVDLDFVNPYFRSREAREYLNQQEIQVLASAEECFDTDIPALSPKISGVLRTPDIRVFIDLGGEDTGARAIGRFRNHIRDEDYELCFVVNPFRPFTSNISDIIAVMERIENASRLKVTSLISNPNLGLETTVQDVMAGHSVVTKTAEKLELPIRCMVVEESLASKMDQVQVPVFPLQRIMLTPWEE